MSLLRSHQNAITIAFATGLAVIAGLLLVYPAPKAIMLLGVLVLIALAAIAVESPLAIYAAITILLGIFSESPTDGLIPGNATAWDGIVAGISPAEVLLALLVIAAIASHLVEKESPPVWPGAPALAAAALVAAGIGSAIAFHELRDGLHVTQPSITLLLAIVAGYWLARRFGSQRLLLWFVIASALLLPQGLYNGFVLHTLSYYDSSPIFLLGAGSILVAFRVVDLAAWRIPYLVLAALVIVLSLRRAAWIDIVVALTLTGIWSKRSGFRVVVALAAGALIVLELISPGIAFSHLEHAVKYVTGAQGREASTEYRRWETANAWANVQRHPLSGIGPSTNWTLFNSFDNRFRPAAFSYLHNSYLWVWLRFGLLGLAAFVGLFATSLWKLLGRRLPLESTVIGAMIAGLAIAVYTASFLTTTVRWPTTVGLLLGIGLAARSQARAAEPVLEPATTSSVSPTTALP
ncbi:MAG: O-antigen ligase family protein [Gaiellaceae bacterium]